MNKLDIPNNFYTLELDDKEIGAIKKEKIGDNFCVIFAATHAGIVNKNNFFYIPSRMEKGVSTLLEPFSKPILINHEDKCDPLGRVVSARYVNTTNEFKLSFKDFENSSKFKDFCEGQLSIKDQLYFIRDNLHDNILSSSNVGLGFIEVTANIANKEAQEKFLDKRYLTFSVNASTSNAYCSVCLQDWSKEPCEHKPGKTYKNKKMFLIAGDFVYGEVSVVNKPADDKAVVLNIFRDGIKDSYVMDSEENKEIYKAVKVYFSKEKEIMEIKDTDKKAGEEVLVDDKKNESVKEEVAAAPILSEEEFIAKVLDSEQVEEEDSEKMYQIILDSMKQEGLTEEEIKDAKLTTEERNNLPKSKFCGPNRSFPVPDCAHVIAARRLINRYEGANKEKILACVERKEKALGCKKKEIKDNLNHVNVLEKLLEIIKTQNYSFEESKPLDEKAVLDLQTLIEKIASLVTKDSFMEAVNKNQELKKLQDKQLIEEIISLEDLIGNLRDEVSSEKQTVLALREEMELSNKELQSISDNFIETKKQLRCSRFENYKTFKILNDKASLDLSDDGTLLDSFLVQEIENISKNIDFGKITDKLNDGITQNPNEEIIDENIVAKKNKEFKIEDVKQELDMIQSKFLQMRFVDSYLAENYLKLEMSRMKKEGKIPEN